MEKSDQPQFLFGKALNKFLIELEGLFVTLPLMMESIGKLHVTASNNIGKFLSEKATLQSQKENITKETLKSREIYHFGTELYPEFQRLQETERHFNAAASIIPNSFIVAIVSQYDAFVGSIIRAIYNVKPEMLDASERQLSFSELIQFGSVEAAREYVLEKEVESVLRESHTYHFEWLEKKLGIPLRKDLNIWQNFIELTERRNLFVHTGGIISSQYINICNKQSVPLDRECKVGKRLSTSKEYWQQAYETLYEIATKLSQVIWRKLIPEQIEDADGYLNSVCYSLLKQEKYGLAKRILSFARGLPRHFSLQHKLIFTINCAIAYKWGGEPDLAKKLISETDWTACSDDFRLTSTVLLDDFDAALCIMRKIGSNGAVKKVDYKDWPAFKVFRDTEQFRKMYHEIFGELPEAVEVSEEITSDGISKTKIKMLDDEVEPENEFSSLVES